MLLIKAIIAHVTQSLQRNPIPSGTRDIGEYFLWAVIDQVEKELAHPSDRHSEETRAAMRLFLDTAQMATFEGYKSAKKELNTFVEQVLPLLSPVRQTDDSPAEHLSFPPIFQKILDKDSLEVENINHQIIKKAFLNMLIDAALDVDGKDEKAERLAITPIAFQPENESPHTFPSQVETVSLPGSELEAFSGFNNFEARAYSFHYGRYCAGKVLERTDFRAYYDFIFPENGVGKLPTHQAPYPYNPLISSREADPQNEIPQKLCDIHHALTNPETPPPPKSLYELFEDRILWMVPEKYYRFIAYFVRKAHDIPFVILLLVVLYAGLMALLILYSFGQFELEKGELLVISICIFVVLGGIPILIRELIRKPFRKLEKWMQNVPKQEFLKELSFKLVLDAKYGFDRYYFHCNGQKICIKSQFQHDHLIRSLWNKSLRNKNASSKNYINVYWYHNRKGVDFYSKPYLRKNSAQHPLKYFEENSVLDDDIWKIDEISFGNSPAKQLLKKILKILLFFSPLREKSPYQLKELPPSIGLKKGAKGIGELTFSGTQEKFIDNLEVLVRPVIVCRNIFSDGWTFEGINEITSLEDQILHKTE